MIVDAVEMGSNDLSAPRTLIVGSGPVGLILALYLARRGNPVLVLEAGDTLPSSENASDLDLEFSAATLTGGVVGRTRQIGGGLNLWGGQLACFEPCEFKASEDVGGWPISLAEITSRFPMVTELLGEPSIAVPPRYNNTEKRALALAGLDVVATAWLKRPKLAARIWKELKTSSLVTLVKGAFVNQILLDPATGAVNGLSASLASGTRLVFSGTAVILACGTIETCRLLLQKSASGEAQPWHDLCWLGRGFNEHLDADTATVRPLNSKRLFDLFDPIVIDGSKYTHKIFSQIDLTAAPPLSCVAMLSMPGNLRNSVAKLRMLLRSLAPRDLQQHAGQIAGATLASAAEIIPLAWRYVRHKRIGTVLRGQGVLRISVEQPSRADNRITLSTTRRDSRGIPTVKLHWYKGAEEGRAFLEMTRKVKRWAESNAIAELRIDPLLLEHPKIFAEKADDGLHHAGGTRMARGSQDGVVNPDLKVFGVDRLYCCGASVFPRTGFANPTMTSMALAVRLGEHLIATGRVPT